MRRKDREITDRSGIIRILGRCRVCRIAMIDKERPYIVPMNFGYEDKGNALTLFFHSAEEGRKIGLLKTNSCVCFEADCGHELVESDDACKNGFLYESVIGEGNAVFITENGEKKYALNRIMMHQCGRNFVINDDSVKNVAVFKINVTAVSGKKCGRQ